MATNFLFESFKHPRRTGAIAPSSRALACALASDMELETASLVVEFGPGTGAVTREILARVPLGARVVAVEANPVFCRSLRVAFPEVLVEQATVARLPYLLERRGLGPVDAIISGIPWTLVSSEARRRDLAATAAVLRDGGLFATFLYRHGLVLPAAIDLREQLGRRFRDVWKGPAVWNNLPPAVVLRCRK